MFDDFHNDKEYLARTVQFFEKAVGVSPQNAHAFGGFGHTSSEPTVRRGKLLLVGEAAGLQDALFGFGMRYALVSGHVAGCAFVDDDLPAYEAAYRRRLRPSIRAAAVNRYLYRRTGSTGYRRLVERVSSARDPRAWLRQYYSGRWWTALMYPLARAEAQRLQAGAATHGREGCDCTYCRCVREAANQNVVHDAVTTSPIAREKAETVGSGSSRTKAC
jgi:flavin-dependent dehydrogenase